MSHTERDINAVSTTATTKAKVNPNATLSEMTKGPTLVLETADAPPRGIGGALKRAQSLQTKPEATKAGFDIASVSETKIDELKATFLLFDKNNDGMISPAELCDVLKFLGQEPTLEDVKVAVVTTVSPTHDAGDNVGGKLTKCHVRVGNHRRRCSIW